MSQHLSIVIILLLFLGPTESSLCYNEPQLDWYGKFESLILANNTVSQQTLRIKLQLPTQLVLLMQHTQKTKKVYLKKQTKKHDYFLGLGYGSLVCNRRDAPISHKFLPKSDFPQFLHVSLHASDAVLHLSADYHFPTKYWLLTDPSTINNHYRSSFVHKKIMYIRL